ncbi:MAG: hypothetical protein KBS86_02515, partial [Proteobacteria bacterium]|nr:hypothetical protein [Candidatus Enterousia scatequi]
IILWLLAMTLSASFWLNTQFGFNIFARGHWKYLSITQASGAAINPWFYISIALIIAITIGGMYMIVQLRNHTITPKINATPVAPTEPAPVSNPERPHSPYQSSISRQPPVLDIKNIKPNDIDTSEIKSIFESNGYIVKTAPYVNRVQLDLFAVGTGEVLWLGAHNISTNKMQEITDKLNNVFKDTLEDIEITINAFIISPSESVNTPNNILIFTSISDLSQYMSEHQNPPVPDDDDGNFDAYSEYMSTVAEYIGSV